MSNFKWLYVNDFIVLNNLLFLDIFLFLDIKIKFFFNFKIKCILILVIVYLVFKYFWKVYFDIVFFVFFWNRLK